MVEQGLGISPLSAMPGQGFGCFANRQDENTQKGQLPSSYFSSTIRSLAESKGWNAKNKNSREKTRFLNFIFFFFFLRRIGASFRNPSILPPLRATGTCLGEQQLVSNSLSLNYHSLIGRLGWITAQSRI